MKSSIFGTLILGMALLMVGCATPPGPGESHSGMDWQAEAKRAGLKGDSIVVALVETGPYAGVGEFPGPIEWSEKGAGFFAERVEVVLTDEELAFLWWNEHLEEITLLEDYSFSLSEIDRIDIEDEPYSSPNSVSPVGEAIGNTLQILSLKVCEFKHFYIQSGDDVVQFTTRIFESRYGPIIDSLINESGIEVWEKGCMGKSEQRSTKTGPIKVIKT